MGSGEGKDSLTGKVALITGAARGTGAVTARRFAEEGAQVAVTDVRDDLGAAVAADLGEGAFYQHLDVTDEADWATAVAATVDAYGGIENLRPETKALLENLKRSQRIISGDI